jgi:hypothetical protein
MTPHPALPGLLLATARESWDAWSAVTRLVLADLLDEMGRPAPWLRRGLHPKALARALGRGRRASLHSDHRAWVIAGRPPDLPPSAEMAPCCWRRQARFGLAFHFALWHRPTLHHCLRLVRRHLAGGDTPPDVAGCVERERRRFRRRALCLFPGVLVTAPCPGGSVTCPAPDLLPQEPGRRWRHRRGHAALDRAIAEAVLPPFPPA